MSHIPIRQPPWYLTSSDHLRHDLSPIKSELKQPEELNLEINSRFRPTNAPTGGKVVRLSVDVNAQTVDVRSG